MEDTQYSLIEAWKRLLDYICSNSSCHGGNWAMKLKSSLLKISYQIIVLLAQVFMFSSVIFTLFFEKLEPTYTYKHYQNSGTFPNLIICNHQMFDKAKVQGM